ncbi:MAG: ATP-dependent DNA helicase RecG [Candidatus Chaera renei]|uniref:Probable DNA 3'-5' helicase RecG n=1 Tax=Candidatus Chaera renei TaxID=2506947 RepID=A0A4Q0AII4_9BACT|nr:MAG: ATP-dependent DNA helicase RecG [Candidatus Chaera renei]
MRLDEPIETLKGVGPKGAEKFRAAGILTVKDLIYNLPRTYQDFSKVVSIAKIKPGNVSLRVRVAEVRGRRLRRSLHISEAVLEDDSGKLRAVWFNQPYRVAQLDSGGEFLMSGEYGFWRDRYQLMNPGVEKASELPLRSGHILPTYRETKGLKSYMIRRVMARLRPLIVMIPESLPSGLLAGLSLPSLSEALLALHFPTNLSDIEVAKRRLAYEELLIMQLGSLLNKQENAALKSWRILFDEPAAKAFVAALPFKLTDSQRAAAWQIIKDLDAPRPMTRLLQGDVGSGKTVVAGMAAFMAARAGFQTAFLAPTEILARQHADTLYRLLEPFGIEVALLVGSLKPAAKDLLKRQIVGGSVAVTVGTHALLTGDTRFKKLGLVVVDEQHRFGVAQRRALLKKSSRLPHLLTMTATPIPRSLALTLYGELDISLLKQKPAGRQTVITRICSPNSRDPIYKTALSEIAAGHSIYVVCPAINEGGDSNEIKNVENEIARLRLSPLKNCRIGQLHGQMKPADKEAAIAAFALGKLDLLVATSVVEVGVDVPRASVMVVEGAERFGLAQLHQLRGRVGRSDRQSYCFLVPSTSAAPGRRLREVALSDDGFYLAEADLKLRGPGEVYGQAQHGRLPLRFADLTDANLVGRARSAARRFLSQTPDDLLKYQQLNRQVEYFRHLTSLN